MVSAGAKIIGSFTVGANSKIGAGSVVIEEVPPNCTVVGIPGRVVRQKNMKVPRTSMDHCHLPDPVLDDLKTLQKEYTEVTNRLLEVEKELRFIKNKKYDCCLVTEKTLYQFLSHKSDSAERTRNNRQ